MSVRKDLGMVTAYAYAVSKGYTGTEEEFAALMADYAAVGQRAEAAATAAAASATEASGSASDSAASATAAEGFAGNASTAAGTASQAAQNASQSATAASGSATAAAGSATAAAGSATTAGNKATEAAQSATGAAASATTAESAKTAAQAAQTAAETAQTAAEDAQAAAEAAAQTLVIDPTLTQPNQAAEAKAVGEALKLKANIDGYYADMTVGNAEQLVATVGIEDKVPYNFRTSGGSADIGDREVDMLVGGSIVWNQIIRNGNFANGTTGWSASASSISASDGVLTLTKNENTGSGIGYVKPAYGCNFIVGHKYMAHVDYKGIVGKRLVVFSNSGRSGMTAIVPEDEYWHKVQRVFNVEDVPSVPGILWLSYDTTTGDNVAQFRNYAMYDLTRMFGEEIADYIYSLEQTSNGAGVAWFKKLFPKDYYAYDIGSLQSVNASSHDMTGFNQFDKSTAVDNERIASSTGLPSYNVTWFHSDYIRVVPNTLYYTNADGTGQDYVVTLYDADKNYISRAGNLVARGTFNTGDATYIIVSSIKTKTSADELVVNLSWDGERDGEYEPYELHSYALDSDLTLRGIPKLDANNSMYYDGDTYESDGTVTRRYGIFDLGSTNYAKSTSGLFQTTALQNVIKKPSTSLYVTHIIFSAMYLEIGSNEITGPNGTNPSSDRVIAVNTQGLLYINNLSYTDVADFKAAMSGVYLIYELVAPTTETASGFSNPQIVNDFGTEEYVDYGVSQGTRDVSIPVGHETTYQANLRAKLEMAPDSPEGDGDYIVRQTNGQNEYVPLVIPEELPDAPTTDGNYLLKCTVSSGTATYTWEAQA